MSTGLGTPFILPGIGLDDGNSPLATKAQLGCNIGCQSQGPVYSLKGCSKASSDVDGNESVSPCWNWSTGSSVSYWCIGLGRVTISFNQVLDLTLVGLVELQDKSPVLVSAVCTELMLSCSGAACGSLHYSLEER